jgi:hypothetical protein
LNCPLKTKFLVRALESGIVATIIRGTTVAEIAPIELLLVRVRSTARLAAPAGRAGAVTVIELPVAGDSDPEVMVQW